MSGPGGGRDGQGCIISQIMLITVWTIQFVSFDHSIMYTLEWDRLSPNEGCGTLLAVTTHISQDNTSVQCTLQILEQFFSK